ncbi:MAG: putative addiction module antidote protein [Burkholderiales bacterium]|jgi:probable addiction module antidote protein|nr:putative addiction module antidote protein [Burkholderiales bacterium]
MKLTTFDAAQHLKTNQEMAVYLDEMLSENDPAMITHALGVIARAKGMTQLAKETGVSREGLYKALSSDGNPEFSTVLKVIKALGLTLHATA